MRSRKSSTPHFDTLDQLLDRLGNIPPSRIRMNPPPGTATEEDVIRARGRLCQVRLQDVAFYSWKQFPGRLLPRGSILDRVPDLAVEVLSPTNTKKEMARKRKEYFLGGCTLVWEVDPIKRTVRVYTAPDESKLVREKGTLDGGTVLPGFKLPMAKWFERAGRVASE